jgi:diaminopimelate epimerase
MSHLQLVKGHGTGNDFVLLVDDEGTHDLSADFVSKICDRRFGLGGDGLIRVVRTRFAAEAEIRSFADRVEWFMDYRNADGSIAEMCGNGARVFAHFLATTGRVGGDEFLIMTRSGMRWINRRDKNVYAVEMGIAQPLSATVSVTTPVALPAHGVLLPNPHAVVIVPDVDEVGALNQSPTWEPESAFPEGANVEFVQVVKPSHIKMRVFERGVGETLSCGTGACAAAFVARTQSEGVLPSQILVDVPGGTVWVEEDIAGEITLVGPAELVGEFQLHSEWLEHRGKI